MRFVPLYSGSSGNCILVESNFSPLQTNCDGALSSRKKVQPAQTSGQTKILIDCGKSAKMICEALHVAGCKPEEIAGILITHEHSDHISGAGVMARKYHIPIYANADTWAAMECKLGVIPEDTIRVIENSDFYVGNIGVDTYSISHDAAHPIGYRLWCGDMSVSVATDLGRFTSSVKDAIKGSSVILLESNHDVDMLRANCHYTTALKNRILGNRGHLSNEACAQALLQLVDAGTEHFILGHLSGENNTPQLALEVSDETAENAGLVLDRDVTIDVAYRDRVSNGYEITPGKITIA